jgi:hypothetical protein
MPVNPTLKDIVELNYFSGLQDERAMLSEGRRRSNEGFNRLMGDNVIHNEPPAIRQVSEDDDMAIRNRSPQTTYNYPPPIVMAAPAAGISVGGIVAIILAFLLLLLASIGGAWWLLSQRPATSTVSPPPPVQSDGDQYDLKFFTP